MSGNKLSHRFCVAPMMDWTDRHCRYFMRLLSKSTLLYTEMVTTGAILHGDKERFLRFHPAELPLALQLGGSNPRELAQCSQFAENAGFSEINLNVGCPSDRVQNGMIGACLMSEAKLVGECLKAMQQSVAIPVTIKCRIGIDDMDSYEQLAEFVDTVATISGCSCFIIHARIALLKGLSPKENREIPPLNYQRVYDIKQAFPDLEVIINGGITDFSQVEQHLNKVDGVMLGREAYQNPYMLAQVDKRCFQSQLQPISRDEVIESLIPYIEAEITKGSALKHITRHILGLYQGQPGAKKFRRHLSENAYKAEAGIDTLLAAKALTELPTRQGYAPPLFQEEPIC